MLFHQMKVVLLSSPGKFDSFELCRMSTLFAWHVPPHGGLHHACPCKNHLQWFLRQELSPVKSPERGVLSVPPSRSLRGHSGYLGVVRANPGEELRYHAESGPSVNYFTTVYSRQASGCLCPFPLSTRARVLTPLNGNSNMPCNCVT